MALAKVQGRGQVTLPREIRQEACIKPGDVLNVYVVGPGLLKIEVVPQIDIADFFGAYAIDNTADLDALRQEWESAAADRAIKELE